MDNITRRQLLELTKRAQQQGFKGSVVDVFKNPQVLQQRVEIAATPQQQQQGLRGVERQDAPQAMVFPNLPPNTSMNTRGMRFPVDMDMYDQKGHLVHSYKNVPPGIESLPTGPRGATVVERPSFQTGGVKRFAGDPWEYKQDNGKFLTRRIGTDRWLTAKGKALEAIKSKVYNLPATGTQMPGSPAPAPSPAPRQTERQEETPNIPVGPPAPPGVRPDPRRVDPSQQEVITPPQTQTPPATETPQRERRELPPPPALDLDLTQRQDNTRVNMPGPVQRQERLRQREDEVLEQPYEEGRQAAEERAANEGGGDPLGIVAPIAQSIEDLGNWFSEGLSGFERLVGRYQGEDEENIIEVDPNEITIPEAPQEESTPITETYEEIKEYEDAYGPLASFTHTFDNETGGTYNIGGKTLEVYDRSGRVRQGVSPTIPGQAVAHFLRDSDISENQQFAPETWTTTSGYEFVNASQDGKVIGYTRNQIEDPDRYRLMYKRNENGTYSIKYKKLKDITPGEGWSYDLPVSRQHKFSDIDWDGRGKSTGYRAVSYYIPLKDGAQQIRSERGNDHTSIVYKNKNAFSRFSGGSVVLIFTDPASGREIAIDVAGSTNTLRDTGRKIAKKYGISEDEIDVVYHDMGSYSAKPKANNGVVNYNQWYGYNRYNRGFSGAPLVIAVPGMRTGGLEKKYLTGGLKRRAKQSGGVDYKIPSITQTFNEGVPKNTLIQVDPETGKELAYVDSNYGSSKFDYDSFKKGVSYVESKDGTFMINPGSSATGLYGQLFNEIKNMPEIKGVSRSAFAKDTELQNEILKLRVAGKIPGIPGIEESANSVYNEYKDQLESFPYSVTEVGALVNFLGRQGTREYLGYVMRDGKTLEKVFPDLYGKNVKVPNKTPEEYISEFRTALNRRNGGIYKKPLKY